MTIKNNREVLIRIWVDLLQRFGAQPLLKNSVVAKSDDPCPKVLTRLDFHGEGEQCSVLSFRDGHLSQLVIHGASPADWCYRPGTSNLFFYNSYPFDDDGKPDHNRESEYPANRAWRINAGSLQISRLGSETENAIAFIMEETDPFELPAWISIKRAHQIFLECGYPGVDKYPEQSLEGAAGFARDFLSDLRVIE